MTLRTQPHRCPSDTSGRLRFGRGLLLAPMIGQSRPAERFADKAATAFRRPASPRSGRMQLPERTEPRQRNRTAMKTSSTDATTATSRVPSPAL